MPDIIRDTFGDMLEHQLELQRRSFGVDPPAMSEAERAHYVQAMAVALNVEVAEALQEVSWKPWASGRFFNREAFLGELIDAQHFLMNLMLVATDNVDVIIAAYYNKATINAQRQADGYTGTDKCPTCGRANDDASIIVQREVANDDV